MIDDQMKSLLKVWLARFVMRMLFFVPMKKNRVMINIHARKGFLCNPKYIVLKLKEKFGNSVEIFWVTQFPDTCQCLPELGISVVQRNSLKHLRKYIRAKVYITNDAFPAWAVHRKNQFWLNTWHGAMNYKRIGWESLSVKSKISRMKFNLENREPDVFISGSEFFTKNTASSFGFDESVFVKTGLPRNDILINAKLKKTENEIAKIKSKLNIGQDEKIVLYAPTFRKDCQATLHGLDFDSVTKSLENRFGEKWIFLYHKHNFIKDEISSNEKIIDVSDYEDMQELLLASDILISDYSSCMWDFSLMEKPVFVFAPDVENYKNSDRSFAFPIEKWPYQIARTNKELEENVLNFNEKIYKEKIAEHHSIAGRYDTGSAAEQVIKIIEEHLEKSA